MQKGDKKDTKMATPVEIVDAPPRVTGNETILKTNNISAGSTNLSEEELHHLFQFRNLVFLATLSKKALSVVEQNNPYNMVSIKGRVIEQTTEGADEHLKRLAKRYLGLGKYYYRKPDHKRIILKIKPEKIMGLSIHPAFYFLAYSPWNK